MPLTYQEQVETSKWLPVHGNVLPEGKDPVYRAYPALVDFEKKTVSVNQRGATQDLIDLIGLLPEKSSGDSFLVRIEHLAFWLGEIEGSVRSNPPTPKDQLTPYLMIGVVTKYSDDICVYLIAQETPADVDQRQKLLKRLADEKARTDAAAAAKRKRELARISSVLPNLTEEERRELRAKLDQSP